MARHVQDNNRRIDRNGEQAARASELLSARKEARASSGGAADEQAPPQQVYPKSLRQFIMQNLLYILSVIAVVAIVSLIILIVAPGSSETAELSAAEENSYVSPYDWMKLDRTSGRYAYVVDGQVKSRLGIDVSENQHTIDWDAVAADGIEFAMIRLGYRGATAGDLYLDGQYWANFDGARNAGIDCGVYFFSQARTVEEAVEEADFVLEYLGGASLEYPIAFDSEEKVIGVENSRTSNLGNDEMTAIADAFCDRIEAAGYTSLVYGNANDLSRYDRSHLENHRIWWAEYDTPVPTAKIDFVFWQYSNNGEVDGISVPVDMNIDLSNALGK